MLPVKVKMADLMYGAPKGHEDEVGGLPYWRTRGFMGGQGYNIIVSAWKPNEVELAWLNKGGVIVLELHGIHEPIPPISMNVNHKELSEGMEEV